jgi:hypothetical protein
MPLLNWFARKPDPAVIPVPPLHAPQRDKPADAGSRRKAERAAQRELIYPIVRESMVRAGILSTRYKFKLLSVGAKSREYMVLVDIPPEFMTDMERLNEIEALITKAAQARHELVVSGTYWRSSAAFSPLLNSADLPRKPIARTAAAEQDATEQRPLRTGFEKTEIFDPDEVPAPALSPSQHGELR